MPLLSYSYAYVAMSKLPVDVVLIGTADPKSVSVESPNDASTNPLEELDTAVESITR